MVDVGERHYLARAHRCALVFRSCDDCHDLLSNNYDKLVSLFEVVNCVDTDGVHRGARKWGCRRVRNVPLCALQSATRQARRFARRSADWENICHTDMVLGSADFC